MEPVDLSFPFYTIQAIREESGKPFQAVLAVEQSHAIVCEIDLNSLTVRVPRIPLTLDAVRPIAAGWTAKISIVRENDDRETHTRSVSRLYSQ